MHQVLTLATSKVHVFTALPKKGWVEGFMEPSGPNSFMYKVVRMSDVTISLNRFERVDEDGITCGAAPVANVAGMMLDSRACTRCQPRPCTRSRLTHVLIPDAYE